MSQLGRDLDREVLAQLVTMVDRTTYSDEARTPKIALRQIFGRLGLRQELCKLAADSGLLSIEVVAMLGDTAAAVKATLKTLVDAAALGADESEAARELSLMQIAAVWHACHALQTQFATRRAKMEEDPSKVPEMAQEDHAEFRGRFVRNHPDPGRPFVFQKQGRRPYDPYGLKKNICTWKPDMYTKSHPTTLASA